MSAFCAAGPSRAQMIRATASRHSSRAIPGAAAYRKLGPPDDPGSLPRSGSFETFGSLAESPGISVRIWVLVWDVRLEHTGSAAARTRIVPVTAPAACLITIKRDPVRGVSGWCCVSARCWRRSAH